MVSPWRTARQTVVKSWMTCPSRRLSATSSASNTEPRGASVKGSAARPDVRRGWFRAVTTPNATAVSDGDNKTEAVPFWLSTHPSPAGQALLALARSGSAAYEKARPRQCYAPTSEHSVDEFAGAGNRERTRTAAGRDL